MSGESSLEVKGGLNPFGKAPQIYSVQELLDIAFGRVSKLSLSVPSRRVSRVRRRKTLERQRVKMFVEIILGRLKNVLDGLPFFELLDPFWQDMLELHISSDDYKRFLGRIKASMRVIEGLEREYVRKVSRAESVGEIVRLRKAAFGRIVSVLKKLDNNLNELRGVVSKLGRLPAFDRGMPTIVVGGYPNVGKSTLVNVFSTAKLEIAEYPFTTREIGLGHIFTEKGKCQIVDTPGLLDRPLKDRNKIELRAIFALKHFADLIIFMIDPSETCGYPSEKQVNLYREVKEYFSKVLMIVAVNKVDIVSREQIEVVLRSLKDFQDEIFEISLVEDINVKSLKDRALELLFESLKGERGQEVENKGF
ncbi:MAG: NOG1 family protein [Candidatus Hodarchaeota archaeon]